MIFPVLSVYDAKARAFAPPLFVSHVDVGIRAFTDAVNMAEHPLGKFPQDYTLYHVGFWNDHDCTFELLPQVKILGLGLNFKKGVNDVQRQEP